MLSGLHTAYRAAFRGGTPPHPVHPESRAWSEQHVELGTAYELHREGTVLETGTRVLSFTGAWHGYRPEDFAKLCSGARDPRFHALVPHQENPHG